MNIEDALKNIVIHRDRKRMSHILYHILNNAEYDINDEIVNKHFNTIVNSNKNSAKYISFIKTLLRNFIKLDLGLAISDWILSEDEDVLNNEIMDDYFSRFFYYMNKIFYTQIEWSVVKESFFETQQQFEKYLDIKSYDEKPKYLMYNFVVNDIKLCIILVDQKKTCHYQTQFYNKANDEMIHIIIMRMKLIFDNIKKFFDAIHLNNRTYQRIVEHLRLEQQKISPDNTEFSKFKIFVLYKYLFELKKYIKKYCFLKHLFLLLTHEFTHTYQMTMLYKCYVDLTSKLEYKDSDTEDIDGDSNEIGSILSKNGDRFNVNFSMFHILFEAHAQFLTLLLAEQLGKYPIYYLCHNCYFCRREKKTTFHILGLENISNTDLYYVYAPLTLIKMYLKKFQPNHHKFIINQYLDSLVNINNFNYFIFELISEHPILESLFTNYDKVIPISEKDSRTFKNLKNLYNYIYKYKLLKNYNKFLDLLSNKYKISLKNCKIKLYNKKQTNLFDKIINTPSSRHKFNQYLDFLNLQSEISLEFIGTSIFKTAQYKKNRKYKKSRKSKRNRKYKRKKSKRNRKYKRKKSKRNRKYKRKKSKRNNFINSFKVPLEVHNQIAQTPIPIISHKKNIKTLKSKPLKSFKILNEIYDEMMKLDNYIDLQDSFKQQYSQRLQKIMN